MFLIVATFKSNKTTSEVQSWVAEVSPHVKTEIAFAPSFPHLATSQWQLGSLKSKLVLAAQDVSPFPPGSYTGAVNAVQLKDLGVKYTLVGHSERRRYFHETHAEISNKITELLTVGITPILCLSEEDVFPQLAAMSSGQKSQVIYCFEPPSAIGGTSTAPEQEIKRVTNMIKESVEGRPVMYGGSVNADNIKELLTLSLDGVLVSSASLDSQEFIKLIKQTVGSK